MRGMRDTRTQQKYVALLSMLDGVFEVQANPASERLRIEYDHRRIAPWQLAELAHRLQRPNSGSDSGVRQAMDRHKALAFLPAILLAGVVARRIFFGRSRLADSVLAFEAATLVSVFTGYPPLRRQVSRWSARAGVSDELILGSAALFLAVIRESYLVFGALFLLSYSAYRKKHNTLAAAARAGEFVAGIDSENEEPAPVGAYARFAGRAGITLAAFFSVVARDPRLASTLLLAANPRPSLISARYGLNRAEILTHEDCRYIPMHTGMDLYALPDASEIVILRAAEKQGEPGEAPALPVLSRLAARPGVQAVTSTHVEDFAGYPPRVRGRNGRGTLRRIVLVKPDVGLPAVHQRQGGTLYLQGDEAQLLQNLELADSLRGAITRVTMLTGFFNTLACSLSLSGWGARRINDLTDAFTVMAIGSVNSIAQRGRPDD